VVVLVKQQDPLDEEGFRRKNLDTEDHSLGEPTYECGPEAGRVQRVPNQLTTFGLPNADLELLRRIRRIAEVLAELTREYEAKPNPQNLESIRQWAAELADLSVRLRTTSQEERSATNQAEKNIE